MLPAHLTAKTIDGTRQISVSSADFVRQFGQLRQRQDDETIVVTHHGRPTHVLLSAARYAAISEREIPSDPTAPSTREMVEHMTIAVLILDTDLTITVANHVMHMILGRANGTLIGQNVFDTIPELKDSLVETCIRRAIRGREPCSAELPSLLHPETWVRVNVYPSACYTTILFRDITEDVQRHRMADAKNAIRDAMWVHAGISYVSVNTRGHIEQADDSFHALMHLSDERLRHVALADLVPVGHRVMFRETMDAVLSGKGPRTVDTQLLANDGAALAVSATIAELRSIYGNEGAVVLLTRQ